MRVRLASASPRRAELLRSAGFDVVVTPARVDEVRREGESPVGYVERLSREKAEAVWETHSDLPVLGADTVVVREGEVLEKPADPEDAFRMLTALSGARHGVITGFTLMSKEGTRTRSVETEVVFRQLSREGIRTYIESGDPLDKAGAYGIQSGAAHFVSRIEGSYTNVVGLPMAEVVEALLEIEHPWPSTSDSSGRRPLNVEL